MLPIYGGQSYTPQLNALKRGTHVIVATPGRVMDHLQRGTLSLATLKYVVLDEADEMLQMGFVDAIDEILGMAPKERQVALFSATLPKPIRNIAQKHLRSPREVTIRSKTTTATNIRQRYWVVSGMHKLDALTRILEVEAFDAMLVFARTKQATVELVEKLEARGFASAALNGDILQAQRERTVAALKAGKVDIVVATESRRAGSTSIASRTSSTSTCPTTANRTCTASAAPAGQGAAARRSCSSRPASGTCCASSSGPRASRSRP